MEVRTIDLTESASSTAVRSGEGTLAEERISFAREEIVECEVPRAKMRGSGLGAGAGEAASAAAALREG